MKTTIKFRHVALLTCTLLMLSVFSSCKNAEERTAEKLIEKSLKHSSGEDVDIDINEERTVIETEDGRVEIDGSVRSWPNEIPSEVPEFKYGKIEALTTNVSDEGKGWTLVLTEVKNDATEKYNSLLKSKGFKTQSVNMKGMGGTITAEKDNIVVFLMAGEGGGSLSIQVEK